MPKIVDSTCYIILVQLAYISVFDVIYASSENKTNDYTKNHFSLVQQQSDHHGSITSMKSTVKRKTMQKSQATLLLHRKLKIMPELKY